MALQLLHLAVHCREMWLKRLRAPARLQPAIGEHFLMSYFPRPPEEGKRCRCMRGGCGLPWRRVSPWRPLRRTEAWDRAVARWGVATWSTEPRPTSDVAACGTVLPSGACGT